MMKLKSHLPLCIGLILFTATQILSHFIELPAIPYFALMIPAIALEIWGIILLARSPEMKNSKLRQWKLKKLRELKKLI